MDKREMLIEKMREMGVPSDLLVQIESAGAVCINQIHNLIWERMGETPQALNMLCSSFASIGASFLGHVLAMIADDMQDEAMAKILESAYETKDLLKQQIRGRTSHG